MFRVRYGKERAMARFMNVCAVITYFVIAICHCRMLSHEIEEVALMGLYLILGLCYLYLLIRHHDSHGPHDHLPPKLQAAY